MSQNQEIIEAKLCAYIDDELDAAGRSELEKHLTANPQHQRLIEELRRTSALVRNLPRASAPTELAEGFGAQLERSVLLEGVSEDVAAADLKAPRWPQLVAMAAITLLTVGLAIVVYFALPGTGGRPQIVQTLPHGMTPMPGAEDDRMADAKTRDFDKMANSEREKSGANKDENVAPAAPAPAAAPEVVASAARKANPLVARMAAVQPSEESKLKEAAGAKSDVAGEAGPVVLVMHSDDPGEARRSLVLYLVKENIAWEPAQAPVGDASLARRDAEDSAHAVGGALAPQQVAAAPAPVIKQLQSEESRERQLAKGAAPTTAPSSESASLASGPANQPAVEAATTPPTALLDEAKRSESRSFRGGAGGGGAGERAGIAKPDFAISCRVTPEQAEALRATLAQPGTSIDALPTELEQKLAIARDKAAGVFEPENRAVPFIPAPSAATLGAPPATNPSADGAPAPTPAPSPVATDELRKLSADAPQPADAGTGSNVPADATTQPANDKVALVDLLIVVRPTDHPSTQPTAPVAAEAPATDPAAPSTPAEPSVPVAPTTQPQ